MLRKSLLAAVFLLFIASCDKKETPSTTGGVLFWTDSQYSIANCGNLTVSVAGKQTIINTFLTTEPTNCTNTTGTAGQGGYILLEQGTHNYTVTSSQGCISTNGTITVTANSCNRIKILPPASLLSTWRKVSDEVIVADSSTNPATTISHVFNNYEGTLVIRNSTQFEQHFTSPTILDAYGTYTLGTLQNRNTIRLLSPVNDITYFYNVTPTQLVLKKFSNVSGNTWNTNIVTFQRQ